MTRSMVFFFFCLYFLLNAILLNMNMTDSAMISCPQSFLIDGAVRVELPRLLGEGHGGKPCEWESVVKLVKNKD